MSQADVRWAKEMVLEAETDGERVDAIGTIRSVETQLAEIRRGAAVEIMPGTEGDLYVMEQGRKANRTFNSTSLIAKVADQLGMNMMQAIGTLLNQGIIEIKWKWTPFTRFARDINLPYTTVQREVTLGDEFDVGENWVDGYPSFKRKEA